MTEIAGLPQWVWDLLRALQRYEEEHPPLYQWIAAERLGPIDEKGNYVDENGVSRRAVRSEVDGEVFVRTPCLESTGVLGLVPRDVWQQAEAIDEYVRFAQPQPEGASPS